MSGLPSLFLRLPGVRPYFQRLDADADHTHRQRLLSFLEKQPHAKIADLGCRDGQFTQEVGHATQAGLVIGMELNPEGAKRARQGGCQTIRTDLKFPLPLGTATLDVITSCQVIEHLPDVDLFLGEIHRVLKPGGYACVATVNLSSWHDIGALILGWQPFSYINISHRSMRVGNPVVIKPDPRDETEWMTHVTAFTLSGLRDLCQAHGFVVERLGGGGYYPFPSWLGRRLSALDPYHSPFVVVKARKPL